MKPPPDIDLAKLCREVREEAGLTQEELGKLLGTTARSVRRWEAGELEPSGQFIAKIFAIRDELEAKQAERKQRKK